MHGESDDRGRPKHLARTWIFGLCSIFCPCVSQSQPIRDGETQNNRLLDPLDARNERIEGNRFGPRSFDNHFSGLIAWFNLRLLTDAHLAIWSSSERVLSMQEAEISK